MMKRYFSFLMLAVFVCVGFFTGIANAATEERVITETIDMDSFHYREGTLPNDIDEYITGWEVRVQDTPALFPFKWEERWHTLDANIDQNTGATNSLKIYVKMTYNDILSIVFDDMPQLRLDILDKDKKLIHSDLWINRSGPAQLNNSIYRRINERVAQQKDETIYFRLTADFSDSEFENDPRVQRLRLALGVEYTKSVDTSIPTTAAWKNVYQKYIDFAYEYYKTHPYPDDY